MSAVRTPGPWAVKVDGSDEDFILRTIHPVGKPDAEVCITTTGVFSDEVEAANTAFIVAACNDYERLRGYEECAAAFAIEKAELRRERDELLTVLKGIMGALDQPVTRRLRSENSIFNGDICVIEHFAKGALAKAHP